MKKTFSAVTGVMLALMMLFVSCEQGGVSKAQIDSRELVAVSFTKVEAKSVNVDGIGTVQTPELANLYFQYKAVKNSADTSGVTIGAKDSWTNLGSQGLGTVIQLSRGKWDISLRGFATAALRTSAGTSETASTQAIFEGSITTDVGSNLASRTENVNVSLDFTNPSGTGSYSLAVSIPASYASQAAKVKVTVTPASGDAQVQTFQFSESTTSHTYSFASVNNGIATVKVEYLDASDVAIGSAVTANTLIMTDMTTNGNASISEDNTFGINFSGTSVNGSAESVPKKTFPSYTINKVIVPGEQPKDLGIELVFDSPLDVATIQMSATECKVEYWLGNTQEYILTSSDNVTFTRVNEYDLSSPGTGDFISFNFTITADGYESCSGTYTCSGNITTRPSITGGGTISIGEQL